jgi:NitT/TauT family transport system substrate-binding protein
MGAALALAIAAAACGGTSTAASIPEAKDTAPVTLRLGYLTNLTHAPAIIGLAKGFFAAELGSNVTLDVKTFNAGPEVITAIFSDALDIAYIGPNPAINGWKQSDGAALNIIAGATSGGAALVVKPSITDAGALKGRKIASPQLGNTQDVALRSWLKSRGLMTTKEGAGDVSIVPQPNSQTLDTFKAGTIDGAWVPEPWATRLQLEAGGKVLVDERTLWPGGQFVTTQVIVRTKFLQEHPGVVARFLKGHVTAVDFANSNPDEAQKAVNAGLEKLTGKPLTDATMKAAWANLTFTVDPIASSLREAAKKAQAVGLLGPVDLKGIYDLGPLNKILAAQGRPQVSA